MAWIQNLKNWERLHDSAEYMKQVIRKRIKLTS